MEKISKCPHCGIEDPALTLRLTNPRDYDTPENIPDFRIYSIICLHCDKSIEDMKIDNTLLAIKALRDEMDKLYGKSRIIPPEIGIWAGDEDKNSLDNLWDYTPWELIKTAFKMILWGIRQRVQYPKKHLRAINNLSSEEISQLKEEAISQAKSRAAEVLGGSPDDYIVR